MLLFFIPVLVASSNTIEMLGDLSITDELSCPALTSDTFYSSGKVKTSETLSATDVTTSELSVTELTLSSLYPTDSEIIIDADVLINSPPSTSSFIQFTWELYIHEPFTQGKSGWSGCSLSTCNEKDYFLLGNFGEEVSKEFTLPQHEQARVSASVHMIDLWQGESVYMKVNGRLLWAHSGNSGSVNLCGQSTNDAAYGIPVDVVIPVESHKLLISFGSTLTSDSGSFGIDDFMIYLK